MSLIRSFQSDDIKAFVASDLPTPSSTHGGLCKFRKMLSVRTAQFLELKDLGAQLDYLLSILGETACPRAWITYYSSVSCVLNAVGTFPENTAEVFKTEAMLGSMCGLRSRYTLIAMRDLWSLRVLKAVQC